MRSSARAVGLSSGYDPINGTARTRDVQIEVMSSGVADRAPSRVQRVGRVSPILRISDLHKNFGSLEVLKGISLQVMPSEVVSIIGASGSGKSTFSAASI